MAEDGIAIPQKAYHRLRADRKSFIRVVAIQEKKFKDYALDEFRWKPRHKTGTMNATLSDEQKKKLLYSGEDVPL